MLAQQRTQSAYDDADEAYRETGEPEQAQVLSAARAENEKACSATEACLLRRANQSGQLAQVMLASHWSQKLNPMLAAADRLVMRS